MKMKILTALPNLQNLELQHNRLTRVNGKMLKYAKDLKTVDLSYNNINSVASQAFRMNANVEKV